jgi:hypothetical protein
MVPAAKPEKLSSNAALISVKNDLTCWNKYAARCRFLQSRSALALKGHPVSPTEVCSQLSLKNKFGTKLQGPGL